MSFHKRFVIGSRASAFGKADFLEHLYEGVIVSLTELRKE